MKLVTQTHNPISNRVDQQQDTGADQITTNQNLNSFILSNKLMMNKTKKTSNTTVDFDSFQHSSIKVASVRENSNKEQRGVFQLSTSNSKTDLLILTLKLKVDNGVEVNTIPIKTYEQIYPENINTDGEPKPGTLGNCSDTLQTYKNTQIHCFGTTMTCCHFNN